MSRAKSREDFITDARLIFGDIYDYSLVEYVNNKTVVKIICKLHGEFEKRPDMHLFKKQGCPKCAIKTNSDIRRKSLKVFVIEANSLHNNFYDYSKFIYISSKTKGIIICPIHGEFEQIPNSHLLGAGCLMCSGRARRTFESVKEESNLIHNFKYEYIEKSFVDMTTKMDIICPLHAVFSQLPSSHIDQKQGCPQCAKSLVGWTRTSFKKLCDKNNKGLGLFYILRCFNKTEEFYKIGITSRTVKKRYSDNKSLPYNYEIVQEIQDLSENIYNFERTLKNLACINNYQYLPIVSFGGSSTECFKFNN